MNQEQDVLMECRDCGLLQRVPAMHESAAAECDRCGATLRNFRRWSVPLCCACSGLGVALMGLALWLPVASVSMNGGRFAVGDLWTGPRMLRQTGAWALSMAVVATLLLMPAFKLGIVLATSLTASAGRMPRWLGWCFDVAPTLSPWAMIDVFLLGATIALLRLRVWADVSFGPALFALLGASFCSSGIDAALDRSAFWRAPTPHRPSLHAPSAGKPISCAGCLLISRAPEGARCPRCGRRLHARKADSVRRTWALIGAAALLAIPANVLPVMTITKFGRGGPSTILGGTAELSERGMWGLAILVFVASILVPFIKLGALSVLLVMTARRSSAGLRLRTRVFRAVVFIGRWSMLDIFATTTLVAMARFGWLGNVLPEPGATAFCAVVILTMLASEAFDPRIMWDAAGENTAATRGNLVLS
jgi:paraquat-inducible protein A